MKLLSYLILPREVTEFERSYLRRLNRISLVFFYLHPPVMMLVAALCHTGPIRALVFTGVLLVGPTLGYLYFTNVRALSYLFGITAMGMGGLLVHFGQGSMQIEMHFYFFVLLALLSVFANPMVILTAAVTVALHHLVLFIVFPRSVFNYDASYWTVGVHALFVVLESVASCFVARSFFDNVIGLERVVQARTRDLRLLLDNAEQGFVSINRDGTLSAERSVILDRWLGPHRPERTLGEYLRTLEPVAAEWFECGWQEVWADVMPLEVTLEQLPRQVRSGAATFQLDYKPLLDADGKLSQVLLVMSDVTSRLANEHGQALQREMLEVFLRITRDRRGFVSFCEEAATLVDELTTSSERPIDRTARELHTLKGNAAIFGVSSLAAVCHQLETSMKEDRRGLTPQERDTLRSTWTSFMERIGGLLGERGAGRLEIEESDHQELLTAIESGVTREVITETVKGWRHESTSQRLDRFAVAARELAKRLRKGEVRVITESNKLRLPEGRWAPFWRSFTHLIRNAVDHGLEEPEERRMAGKPAEGTIRLVTQVLNERLVIGVADDGRGVQWQRVAEKARRAGLRSDTQEDLLAALFTAGISTKEVATEVSGRGIGLGAVKAACEAMGGSLRIDTTEGRGTSFEASWPASILSEGA